MSHKIRSKVIAAIIEERFRQISTEGWSGEHDDSLISGQLSGAASAYAMSASASTACGTDRILDTPPPFFMFSKKWWKPTTPYRDLIKAGALIIAELERLERLKTGVDL